MIHEFGLDHSARQLKHHLSRILTLPIELWYWKKMLCALCNFFIWQWIVTCKCSHRA